MRGGLADRLASIRCAAPHTGGALTAALADESVMIEPKIEHNKMVPRRAFVDLSCGRIFVLQKFVGFVSVGSEHKS
jgi:hypothetical protein